MRFFTVVAASALLVTAASAGAQSTWDKTYNPGGRPALQVSVDVASLVVRSCGDCRAVRIHVDARGADLSRWHITEMQGGNVVHFDLKRREEVSVFGGWKSHSPEVTVDLPAESDVELHSGNGSVQMTGVHGSVDAKTGNGAMTADDVRGAMRLTSGNGRLTVHRADGTVSAVSGNGEVDLEGRLTQVEVRSGNGAVQVVLQPGTVLSSSSRVSTGHGAITMTVPRDLKADVDLSSGLGSLHSDLPLLTQTSGDRHIRGSANGGGPSLSLHSGNGSITLSSR